MLPKNFSSLLALSSLAFNVQAGLIPQSQDGAGVSALQARTAPHLERRVSQPNLDLAKRALPPLSDFENGILRLLSVQIRDRIKDTDLVLFVGNSGSYLLYPFNQESLNVHSLPASKTKFYGTNKENRISKASKEGLDRYFNEVLYDRLAAASFNRIVIVDHSHTGKSIDGFRRAFEDIINRAKDTRLLGKDGARDILDTPWYFINVVDWGQSPESDDPPVEPKSDIIKKISVITVRSDYDVINEILADEEWHPRVSCEFPASRWAFGIRHCWGKDKTVEAAREQQRAAEEQQRAIIAWNKANGGLIDKNNPKRESSLGENKDRILGNYYKHGVRYQIRVDDSIGYYYHYIPPQNH